MSKISFTILFLICILFSVSNLKAQEFEFLSHAHHKYKASIKIVNAIARNYCPETNFPGIEINTNKNLKTVARYYSDKNKIIADEELYDLCMSFGKDSLNALAVVIGHEVGHHFLEFSTGQTGNENAESFINYPGNEIFVQGLNVNVKNVLTELRADLYGNFFSYLSGYSSFNIASDVYNKVYAHYKIEVVPVYYPTKKERQLISEITLEDIQKYVCIYDAAELLFFKGRYFQAAKTFEFLLNIFPSREMFNNTGVSYLLYVLSFFSHEDLPYILPVEYEPKTRLYLTLSRPVSQVSKEEQDSLLQRSIIMFKESVKREANYYSAHINMASAFYLLNETDSVKLIISKLVREKHLPVKIKNDANILKAVLLSDENTKKSIKYFEKISNHKAFDKYNYLVSKGTKSKIDTMLKRSALFFNRRLDYSFNYTGYSEVIISAKPEIKILYRIFNKEDDNNIISKYLISNREFQIYGSTEFIQKKELQRNKSNFFFETVSGTYFFFKDFNKIIYYDNDSQFSKHTKYYIKRK